MSDTAGDGITIAPANETSWDDIRAVFGTRGTPARCQCQSFKVRDKDWRSVPVEDRADRLREQSHCGDPGADTTSGLVAYLDGEPAGWWRGRAAHRLRPPPQDASAVDGAG